MAKTIRKIQEKQDRIFKKMPADKKLELWAGFWLLAKELVGNKKYGKGRPSFITDQNR